MRLGQLDAFLNMETAARFGPPLFSNFLGTLVCQVVFLPRVIRSHSFFQKQNAGPLHDPFPVAVFPPPSIFPVIFPVASIPGPPFLSA